MILVTGATGNTGSKLVRLLAEAGAPARALVRSPEKAASIHRLGLETVLGDFEQPDTLDAAMAGCDHLFLLSPPSPHQACRTPCCCRAVSCRTFWRRRRPSPYRAPCAA